MTDIPARARIDRREAVAVLLAALIVIGSALTAALLIGDDTPLLTRPRPDLRVPAGLIGGLVGFVAAVWVATQPPLAKQRRRWTLLIMSPLFVGFAFSLATERLYEAISFRAGARAYQVTAVRILSKSQGSGRRSDNYEARIVSPIDGHAVDLSLDRTQFDRIEPARDCLDLQVERARNGAVRMLGVLRAVPCAAAAPPSRSVG